MKIKIIYDDKGNQQVINVENGEIIDTITPMGDLVKKPKEK